MVADLVLLMAAYWAAVRDPVMAESLVDTLAVKMDQWMVDYLVVRLDFLMGLRSIHL